MVDIENTMGPDHIRIYPILTLAVVSRFRLTCMSATHCEDTYTDTQRINIHFKG